MGTQGQDAIFGSTMVCREINTVLITNMGPSIRMRKVVRHFKTVGAIKTDWRTGRPSVDIFRNNKNHSRSGDVIVTFVDPVSAQRAVAEFDGTTFQDRVLTVKLYRNWRSNTKPADVVSADDSANMGYPSDAEDEWRASCQGKDPFRNEDDGSDYYETDNEEDENDDEDNNVNVDNASHDDQTTRSGEGSSENKDGGDNRSDDKDEDSGENRGNDAERELRWDWICLKNSCTTLNYAYCKSCSECNEPIVKDHTL